MTNNDLRFLEVFSVSDPFVTGQMSKLIQSCQSRTEHGPDPDCLLKSHAALDKHTLLTFAALWVLNTLKTYFSIGSTALVGPGRFLVS
jgi:hypothetical protein